VVPAQRPAGELDVTDVTASLGMELERACVPSGVEVCFDAYDNNCNGVIDEGCGLHTGVLQFTIAWQEAVADIDLNVNGPDGDLARYDKANQSGLLKDRDCPGADNQCYGQNIENVFLAEGSPRRGRYRVVVRLEDIHDASAPIKVRLSARIAQRHFSSIVELSERNEQREFEFTL
jgi:tRNA (guanosine-2'-O-)-methyltransferase